MLLNYEPSLTWDFSKIGYCYNNVIPLVEVKTILYEAQQACSFPVPKSLNREVIEILQECLNASTLERRYRPYRNAQFLVKKKSGGYRLINSIISINAITIYDAILLLNTDEFVEDLIGRPIISLLDFLSSYNQITLYKNSRDMTAIQTLLRLLYQTTLL